MGPVLLEEVRRALQGARLNPSQEELVEAACLDMLGAVLEGEPWSPPPVGGLSDLAGSSAATLEWIEVQGFRGIAQGSRLSLPPGPGLTLVVGRNGSGKSSYVEGLETLLCGTSARWEGRKNKEWEQGWLNVHHDCSKPVVLRAGLLVEGEGPVVLERRFEQPSAGPLPCGHAAFKDGSTLAQRGWLAALESTPPLLSYAELGRLAQARPIDLFRALSVLLGLEEVDAAVARLGQASKDLSAGHKARLKRLPALKESLGQSEDPRARAAEGALGRTWDLGVLEELALGMQEQDSGLLSDLRALSTLSPPPLSEVTTALEQVRAAQAQVAEESQLSVERSAKLAELLEAVLGHLDEQEQDCPVCGTAGVLGGTWRQDTRARLDQAKVASQARRVAELALESAARQLRSLLLRGPSDSLWRAEKHGLGAEAWKGWQHWRELADLELQDQAGLALEVYGELSAALETLRERAQEELERRQGAWEPLRRAIAEFYLGAQADRERAGRAKDLDKARKWLSDQRKALQAARFAPIAAQAQSTWEQLRSNSNLSLDDIQISGAGNKARVELRVSVDDTAAPALGVMSQGELNAMGLALFLPRAMAEQSPFRFLVIDDPVQAMDPYKVDGLARVLSELALTRQVVVFTHDVRLSSALSRLQLPSTVLEVQRAAGSVVRIEPRSDAVSQAITDAFRVAGERDKLGDKLVWELLPMHCRTAIEAAAVQRIRRDKLREGCSRAEVEEQIRGCRGVHPLLTLALFGDTHQGAKLFSRLQGWGLLDAFKEIKAGAHGDWRGEPRELIRDAERIALRTMA